jgi:hypothetical protein
MKPLIIVRLLLLALALSPGLVLAQPPSAAPTDGPLVTVDQVIAMTKAGVSDAAIVALIERDRPVFVLASTHLVMLRKAGVSQPVIVAMLMTPYSYFWSAPVVVYSTAPLLVAPPPPPGTSSRGIFFTHPTRGIFFPPR